MTARRVSLSLERKLPLLISVLLVLLAVGLTWAGYEEVRRSAELRGIERLQQLAAELARLAVRSTEQRFAALRRVAASDAVIAAMTDRAGDPAAEAAAGAALGGLSVSAQDTAVVAELRTVRRARRIATRREVASADQPAASLFREMSRGRAAVGELYRLGDSAFFWTGAPVSHDGRVVGYVLQRRTFRMAASAQRWLRGLSGNDHVSIFFASDSGNVWTGLAGEALALPVVEPHDGDAPNVIRYTRGDGRRYVAVHAPVPSTPLRVLAEVPYDALRERPAAYLRRSVVVASMMLVLGGLAAWLLSRRITRPLRQLTVAASAISAGDYAKRAVVNRGDETGRLADAFNAMAEQVQRSHGELEHRIAETRSLATRLEEANRAKADFLATMSHELRTPLNAIGGYVDLLEMGIRGPLTPAQRHDLERVRHNHRHLLTLIGNILDFARLDAQKLTYDVGDVRVDRAVVEVLTAIEPLLDEKGLDRTCIGCDQPLVARADRARLEQILLNLLSNAVRFTPRGGAVTVTVAPRDEMVEVTVDDTGIGIPHDKLDAIFEPFVQIESGLTRTVGGTGLGLTISRELARAMGGELTGENLARGGARFTLTVPAGAEQAALEGELSGMAEG